MATRKRRFGSVRRLPSGRWQARYRGPDGQMRAAPNTFPRSRDAEQWLTVIESEMLRGEWLDPWLSEVPLSDFGRRWIKDRHVRPRTRDDYWGMFGNHIEPHLGSLAVGEIGTATVRSLRFPRFSGVFEDWSHRGDWEGRLCCQHRGSTPMSCGNGQFGCIGSPTRGRRSSGWPVS